MLSDLDKEIRQQGRLTFLITGTEEACGNFLNIITMTEKVEEDEDWWAVRVWTLSKN